MADSKRMKVAKQRMADCRVGEMNHLRVSFGLKEELVIPGV